MGSLFNLEDPIEIDLFYQGTLLRARSLMSHDATDAGLR